MASQLTNIEKSFLNACRNGNLTVVQQLANQDLLKIRDKDDDYCTPLHNAAYFGHLDILEYLAKEGASIEARDSEQLTPLHLAVAGGDVDPKKRNEIISCLISQGADPLAEDIYGNNAIHSACYFGHPEAVDLLLAHNSVKEAINVWNVGNETALHKAAWSQEKVSETDRKNVLNLLLDAGADLEARDEFAETPLHYACSGGPLESVQLLLQKGANPLAKNKRGNTPLHEAARKGHIEVCRVSLDYGVDPFVKNSDGKTAEEVADENIKTEFAEISQRSRHNDCILLNLKCLKSELRLESFWDSLMENKVLQEHTVETLQSQAPERQHLQLIKELKQTEQDTWNQFLLCLNDTNHAHISWRLRETEKLHMRNPAILGEELIQHFKKYPPPAHLLKHSSTGSIFQNPSASHGPAAASIPLQNSGKEERCAKMKRLRTYITRRGRKRFPHIEETKADLLKHMDVDLDLLKKLISRDVIKKGMKTVIHGAETPLAKNQRLLDKIIDASDDKYFDFLEVLAERQKYLVDKLTGNQWDKQD